MSQSVGAKQPKVVRLRSLHIFEHAVDLDEASSYFDKQNKARLIKHEQVKPIINGIDQAKSGIFAKMLILEQAGAASMNDSTGALNHSA